MNFGEIFSKIRRQQSTPNEAPEHWVKCGSCQSLMYFKEVEHQFLVCPKCSFHMRINAQRRVEMLSDEGTFEAQDVNLCPTDPLKFVDKKSYKKRVSEAQAKTGRTSAAISGECKLDGISIQLICFDFDFMGGSLGSVEGEQIVRAVNRAIEKRQGLVIVSASGGARMQESTFSLLQMSKTAAAIKRLSEEKLPYISVLTDPTMGGVSASFAWLGDIVMAEPQALIGFAGARVIKQTIGADLPEGFQRAEFLLEHGLIDMIVKRGEMKKTIVDMLRFFGMDEEAEKEEEEEEVMEEVAGKEVMGKKVMGKKEEALETPKELEETQEEIAQEKSDKEPQDDQDIKEQNTKEEIQEPKEVQEKSDKEEKEEEKKPPKEKPFRLRLKS